MTLDFIRELVLRDRIFLVLAIVITVALILVILFALFTIYLRLRNLRKSRRWQALEARWEPLLLALITGDTTPEQIQNQVEPGQNLFFVDFVLRFAQRLRGVEAAIITALAKPYLPQLQARIHQADPARRARAIRTLSILALEEYYPDIINALDDDSPLVAMIAARALAREDHPEFAGEILARMHRFANWSQSYLASLLTSLGPAVTPDLRAALTDSGNETFVRVVAADALRSLDDLATADIAAQVLSEEQDRELVAACLRVLAAVGRPQHLEPVRRLCTSGDSMIRAQALRALGSLGGPEDIHLMEQAIADESPWVGLHAARGMLTSGGEERLYVLAASEHPARELARQVLMESSASA